MSKEEVEKITTPDQKMAWNEPGGSGNKDPWGNKNNQDGPPDLDEVFKKLNEKEEDRLKTIFSVYNTGTIDFQNILSRVNV